MSTLVRPKTCRFGARKEGTQGRSCLGNDRSPPLLRSSIGCPKGISGWCGHDGGKPSWMWDFIGVWNATMEPFSEPARGRSDPVLFIQMFLWLQTRMKHGPCTIITPHVTLVLYNLMDPSFIPSSQTSC